MGWQTNNPTLSAQRQAQDPLRDLSLDMFGQPQQVCEGWLSTVLVFLCEQCVLVFARLLS